MRIRFEKAGGQFELGDFAQRHPAAPGELFGTLALDRRRAQNRRTVSRAPHAAVRDGGGGKKGGDDGAVKGIFPGDVPLDENHFDAVAARHLRGLAALDGKAEVHDAPRVRVVAEDRVEPHQA